MAVGVRTKGFRTMNENIKNTHTTFTCAMPLILLHAIDMRIKELQAKRIEGMLTLEEQQEWELLISGEFWRRYETL